MKPFLWIDLEMTGLDENVHHIIEVAALITGKNLEIIEDYHRIVYQPPEVVDLMDEWCQKTHGASGLTAAIPEGTPIKEVEDELINLINRHYSVDDKPVLSGNSVGNDRRFIDKYMPKLAARLHYRIIDVSSFKEVFREQYQVHYQKKAPHRALDDIRESVNELKFYLSHFQIGDSGDGNSESS